MPIQRTSNTTHPLHDGLTVVAVPADEQDAFAHRLAQELVDDSRDVDLRSVVVVTQADIAAIAARLGPERAAERAAVVERAEAELHEAVRARDLALAARDELSATITRLTDDATQSEGVADHAGELTRLVATAAAEAEARRRDVEAARQRLDQVLEQRHAGAAAMERAERELATVTGSGLDEMELRRGLESVSRRAHELTGEDRAAIRQLEALAQEQHAVADRRAALAVERDDVRWVGSVTRAAMEIVTSALATVDARPSPAAPSLRARALADAIADVEARLALIEEDERRARGELVTTLLSQRRGLLADAESVLGNAPGDDVVARLRELGRLPTSGVDDLIAALRTVDVEANATTAVHQANAWLADVAAAHEIAAKCDQEAGTLDQRDTEIATAAAEIERTRVEIADSLASTHTETELITAELTARAGGDQERLGRVAEAQRLCDQVEAVRAALEEAEAVARNELDAAISASSSADDLCDRNARLLAMAGQRAQELAASLSADLRPELGPGPLDGMSDLAAALRESLRRHQREARTVAAAVDHATDVVERATAVMRSAQAMSEGDQHEVEIAEALTSVIAEARGPGIIFARALDGAGAAARHALLAAITDPSMAHAVVVLTDDTEVLGWAIGLPPGVGVVTTAAALAGRATAERTLPAEPVTDQPSPVETVVRGGSSG